MNGRHLPPLEPDEDMRASWHVARFFSVFGQPLRAAINDNVRGWPRPVTRHGDGATSWYQGELFL